MRLTRRAALAASLLPFAARAQGALIPVTLAVSSNSLAYGGLNIATRARLFERHGIALKVVVMDSGNAAISAVLSGSIEFASAGPGEVIAVRLRGQKVVIINNVYRGLSGSLILAKSVADKLPAVASATLEGKLKSLDGLAIATPSATSAYTHPYKSSAEAAGVKIRFVYMAQPAMAAALQAGAIQGLIVGAPFSVTAVTSGAGVLWISGPTGELPASALPASSACLETSEAYAAAHPDIIQKMRAGFDTLSAYLREQPEEAMRMLSAAYPQIDAPTIQAAYRNDAPNWGRPAFTVADIRQEIAIQVASGTLKGAEALDPASLLLNP